VTSFHPIYTCNLTPVLSPSRAREIVVLAVSFDHQLEVVDTALLSVHARIETRGSAVSQRDRATPRRIISQPARTRKLSLEVAPTVVAQRTRLLTNWVAGCFTRFQIHATF